MTRKPGNVQSSYILYINPIHPLNPIKNDNFLRVKSPWADLHSRADLRRRRAVAVPVAAGSAASACHKQSFGVCWSSAAAASGRSCCSWVMAVMDGMIWGVPDTQQMDGFLMGKSQSINAGWWFGTLIPTDFHIVQRVKTTWIFFMIFDCLVVWNNNPN